MRIENNGWFGFYDEDVISLNPRPLPDENKSCVEIYFRNGHKAVFTEEFLKHLAELIEFERRRHDKHETKHPKQD
jgi:hypothetical protein